MHIRHDILLVSRARQRCCSVKEHALHGEIILKLRYWEVAAYPKNWRASVKIHIEGLLV
jgi:hypothetical protein